MSDNFETSAKKIIEGLEKYKAEHLYSEDYYFDLRKSFKDLRDTIENAKNEKRLLKIGIVGEVKAGKSSFLNALIFDGEDVLPKASTPMTAALTKITYSEEQKAKIVFYNRSEWDLVLKYSQEYDEDLDRLYEEYKNNQKAKSSPRERIASKGLVKKFLSKEEVRIILEQKIAEKKKACKELTSMADASGIDVDEFLGKKPMLNIQNMQDDLKDYIGAEGRYTPIVNYVELQMSNPMLKDIEIIDTPGLNDPIISRGEKTKEFLHNCDVVFLLSYCGQFLTQEDISFMCRTLPKEGVDNIIIVGSQFDLGLLDDNRSKEFIEAVNSSAAIYFKQASSNIDRSIEEGTNVETLTKVRRSLPPKLVSSLLYSCAQKLKNGKPYSELEEHIIKRLKENFPDFKDDYKTLLSLSGINQIKKEKLIPIMENKRVIIDESNCKKLAIGKSEILKLLEAINIEARNNKTSVENNDKSQLENKLQIIESRLNTMRRKVGVVFQSSEDEADKFLNNMKVSIDEEIENHVDFTTQAKTHTEREEYHTGFLGLKKEVYTEEVTDYYACISDVIANIRGYVVTCRKMANEEFEKIINTKKLMDSLKTIIVSAFDFSEESFDEEDILSPLEHVVAKIKIPKINIEFSDYEEKIIEEFSDSSVKNEDIHRLRTKENEVLEEIAERLKQELDNCQTNIDALMSDQQAGFVDDVIKLLSDNIETIKKQLDNKEEFIHQYESLINDISEYKQLAKEMEI